ncbi:hypothetical protein SPAN111604_10520 [Sphingomonas antarctica]|uniref:c-type cytochrome n=1 Tax=Sphingomonas antarctica TaxID=2040274 RepID=UPI0039ED588B
MTIAKLVFALAAVSGGFMLVPDVLATDAPPPARPDPVRGSRLFLQCRACHTVAPGAANTVGPNLAGIFGTKAAMRSDYTYSAALTKSGITWTPVVLNAFIKRPTAAVPGTKMGFAGVADATARADLIAYLGTLKGKK